MKPVVAILLLALLLPGTGDARTTLVAPPNGGLEFVAASPEFVLCEKRVTGTPQPELICFDAKDGSVRWRRKVDVSTTACVIEPEGIYRIAGGGRLGKYQQKDGVQVWEVMIQVPTPEIFGPAASPVGGSLSDQKELARLQVVLEKQRMEELERREALFREYSQSLGGPAGSALYAVGTNLCVRLYDHHWAIFRAVDGKFVEYGPGRILGFAGDTAYIAGREPQLILNGRSEQIKAWTNFDGVAFGPVPLAVREDRMLLTDPRGNISFLSTADAQGNISERWKFPVGADELSDAVPVGDYVVRFEQGSRVDNGKTNRKLFVELYNRAGKQVKATRFAAEGTNGTAKRYFFGKTGRGDVVFQQGRELQVVRVPSLKVVNRLQFSQTAEGNAPHGQPLMTTLHWMPGLDAVCEVSPTRFLAYYAEEGATHPVNVRLIDYYSGKTVWSHEETVTIETYSNWKKPTAK